MTFLYAYDPVEQEHTKEGHPENRARLSGTLELLRSDGILERNEAVEAHPISRERLETVHLPEYIQTVDRLARTGGGQLDADTYVGPRSFDAALTSAGALVDVVGAVLRGDTTRGMSLMRPPGHHALSHRGMGFCLFANVALGARLALDEFDVRPVLIVDWDVHHGNGTEAIFYDEPEVAFFSAHQYPFYPGTGAVTDTGDGRGDGFTVNVPLPPGIGDRGYQQVFDEILVPFAERLQPALILVSAGYDAHWRDPLAGENLSLQGFTDLTRCVTNLADRLSGGRLVLALEGGYDLEVLPHAVLNSLRALENPEAPISDPFGAAAHEQPLPTGLLPQLREIHGL